MNLTKFKPLLRGVAAAAAALLTLSTVGYSIAKSDLAIGWVDGFFQVGDRTIYETVEETIPGYTIPGSTEGYSYIFRGNYDTEYDTVTAYAEALRKLRKAYGDVPILCVAPCENTVVFGHLQRLLDRLQDPNLHCAVLTPGVFNWDTDMGANFHPNHRGHRKMASAIIPYIATITGWEMPEKTVY